jgi:hypothetical protein
MVMFNGKGEKIRLSGVDCPELGFNLGKSVNSSFREPLKISNLSLPRSLPSSSLGSGSPVMSKGYGFL